MSQANTDRLSKAEADALRRKDADIRRSIIEAVLTSSDVPDAEAIRTFRSNHAQQRKAVDNGKRRVEQLAQAQADLKPLEDDLRAKHGAVSKAQASLQEFHRPLGQSAFQGLLAGQLKDQPVFYERVALQQRIDALRKEHAGLASSVGAGTIEKAKATAQQLAVTGKIKLEEMRIGKLDSQIGQQLIEQNQEGSVRCNQTEQILGQIAERRRQIAALVEQEAIARNKLSAKATEVARTLNLSQAGSTESLNEELKRCRGSLAEAEQAQAKAERELPAMLLADSSVPPESTLGGRLSELRQTEERLEHVPASAVRGAVDRFRRLSTATKALVGGGIAIGLLLVMCGGGLALFGPGGGRQHEFDTNRASQSAGPLGAPSDSWGAGHQRPQFDQGAHRAGWDASFEDIQREKERQHELEMRHSSQTAGAGESRRTEPTGISGRFVGSGDGVESEATFRRDGGYSASLRGEGVSAKGEMSADGTGYSEYDVGGKKVRVDFDSGGGVRVKSDDGTYKFPKP